MSISVLVFFCVAALCLFVYSARGAECWELTLEPGESIYFTFKAATGPVTDYFIELRSVCWGAAVEISAVAADIDGDIGPWGEESAAVHFVPEPSVTVQLFSGLALLALLGRWRRG